VDASAIVAPSGHAIRMEPVNNVPEIDQVRSVDRDPGKTARRDDSNEEQFRGRSQYGNSS
jgi:hypothetical protein